MKQRLQENFSREWEQGYIKRLPLQESRIIEANGQTYTSTGAYLVPIWRLDKKNLNGRTYRTSLAKKVMESKPVTLALIDHPEGDSASPKNLGAVGKNPQIIEGILYAECHFVNEEFQRQCEKVLALGGKIGLSSSALGELDSQGNVLEESFELERLFDFVPDPSYGVFMENSSPKVDSPLQQHTESVASPVSPSVSGETIAVRNTKMTLEEKNFRFGIEPRIEKAKALTNPFEARAAWNVVAEYCDNEAFAAPILEEARQNLVRIEAEILALAEKGLNENVLLTEKAKLEEGVSAQGEEVKVLQEALSALSAEYETTLDLLENTKRRENKIRKMYRLALAERNGRIRADKFNKVLEYVDYLESELKDFKVGLKESRIDQSRLEEKLVKILQKKQKLEVEKYNGMLEEGFTVEVETQEEPEVSVTGETVDGEQAVGVEIPVETEELAGEEYPEDDGLPADVSDYSEDDMRSHTIVPVEDFDEEAPGRREVRDFYEDMVRIDPANAKYREAILCSRNLIQAQLKFMNLTSEQPVRPAERKAQAPAPAALHESRTEKKAKTSQPDWTPKSWGNWV